jgi:hypothetical protein
MLSRLSWHSSAQIKMPSPQHWNWEHHDDLHYRRGHDGWKANYASMGRSWACLRVRYSDPLKDRGASHLSSAHDRRRSVALRTFATLCTSAAWPKTGEDVISSVVTLCTSAACSQVVGRELEGRRRVGMGAAATASGNTEGEGMGRGRPGATREQYGREQKKKKPFASPSTLGQLKKNPFDTTPL